MRLLASLGLAACLSASAGCSRSSARAQAPEAHADGTYLPARIRRLTNAEYERSVEAFLGAPAPVADRLPPDVRQDGYTPNDDEAVPSAWAAAIHAVAREIAARAVRERLAALVPCSVSPGPSCPAELVETLGRRAFRRPLDPPERAALLAVFEDAAAMALASPAQAALAGQAGAKAVISELLESPNFVYLTELGPGNPSLAGGRAGNVVTLGPYEIASLLSYSLRGGPPDEALLGAAASGILVGADAREEQARRLLSLSDTRLHFRRFVLEWLEVDGLGATAKNSELYPDYEAFKSHMLGETAAFADEVMVYAGGSVRGLLDARFASVDPDMARFYGLKTWGARASLAATRRAGVLQQASFLAAHAHEDTTSPVKRGDFVLRRLLCVRLPRPTEVGLETVFPPPSPAKTTRERFAVHSENAACRGCHRQLDGLGFAFEGFDAAGASRATEGARPVDTRGHVDVGGDSLAFDDSLQLSELLARDPAVADCYLRQAFRYFTAQHDPRVEDELVAIARARSPEGVDNLFEALIVYVRSDLFIKRELSP